MKPSSLPSLKVVVAGRVSFVKEAFLLELPEEWLVSLWYLAIARRLLKSIAFTTSSLLRLSGLSDTGQRAARRLQLEAATLVASSSGSVSLESWADEESLLSSAVFLLLTLFFLEIVGLL